MRYSHGASTGGSCATEHSAPAFAPAKSSGCTSRRNGRNDMTKPSKAAREAANEIYRMYGQVCPSPTGIAALVHAAMAPEREAAEKLADAGWNKTQPRWCLSMP